MKLTKPAAKRDPIAHLLSLVVLFFPGAILGLLAFRYQSSQLAGGAVTLAVASMMLIRREYVWRPPTSGLVVLLYFIALGWCWFCTHTKPDGAAAFVRGVLLLVPLLLVISHDLFRTGAEQRRRAISLGSRLKSRRHWPSEPGLMRHIPEIAQLRENLRQDIHPVYSLLNHANSQVRMAGFLALAGRKNWRPAEVACVIQHARSADDPAVRAMAINALESAHNHAMLFEIGHFLTDPHPMVRAAAVRCALGVSGQRWCQLRERIREYLSMPQFAEDRGLPGAAGHLPAVAICDLTAWASEAGNLSHRSIRALVEHYAEMLQRSQAYDLVTELTVQISDPGTPAILRIELAHLLRKYKLLTPNLLDRLTNSDQPSSIRLLAAEVLLEQNPSDPDALDVLRGLGRQPNREIAMAVAKVLQQQLGFDMGLPAERRGMNAKLAGEIVKRVKQWATARSVGNNVEPTPALGQPGLTPEATLGLGGGSNGNRPAHQSSTRSVW